MTQKEEKIKAIDFTTLLSSYDPNCLEFTGGVDYTLVVKDLVARFKKSFGLDDSTAHNAALDFGITLNLFGPGNASRKIYRWGSYKGTLEKTFALLGYSDKTKVIDRTNLKSDLSRLINNLGTISKITRAFCYLTYLFLQSDNAGFMVQPHLCVLHPGLPKKFGFLFACHIEELSKSPLTSQIFLEAVAKFDSECSKGLRKQKTWVSYVQYHLKNGPFISIVDSKVKEERAKVDDRLMQDAKDGVHGTVFPITTPKTVIHSKPTEPALVNHFTEAIQRVIPIDHAFRTLTKATWIKFTKKEELLTDFVTTILGNYYGDKVAALEFILALGQLGKVGANVQKYINQEVKRLAKKKQEEEKNRLQALNLLKFSKTSGGPVDLGQSDSEDEESEDDVFSTDEDPKEERKHFSDTSSEKTKKKKKKKEQRKAKVPPESTDTTML